MTMTSCAWLWLYIGAALMLMEILSPGFVIFFFGLSAASVGLLRFFFGEALTPVWQMAAFSAFTIFYLAVLRRWLKGIFSGSKQTSHSDFDSEYVGRAGVVTEAVNPPETGRVLIGDAEWTAESAAPLGKGAHVRVVAQKNLTMTVEKIQSLAAG